MFTCKYIFRVVGLVDISYARLTSSLLTGSRLTYFLFPSLFFFSNLASAFEIKIDIGAALIQLRRSKNILQSNGCVSFRHDSTTRIIRETSLNDVVEVLR